MKRKYSLIILAFLIVLFGSCKKFIVEDPQTAFTEEQIFQSLDNTEPFVLGLYTSWRNTKKDRGGFMFILGTDEAQQGAFQVQTDDRQASLDKYSGFLTASNTSLAEQWNSRWPVISGAAKVIYGMSQNTESDQGRRDMFLGEASFIRAALTFEMAQYWGPVPILDQAKSAEYGLKRQPLPLVYSTIIADLENAVKFLPATQSDKRRATRGAALALLGKVYLYAPGIGFEGLRKIKGYL